MDAIEDKFERIGARVRTRPAPPTGDLRVDVASDRRGEFFDLRVGPGLSLEVLDVRPKDRHLVLLVRGEEKRRFLFGHDERHWFVAAVPESSPVTTVAQAKDALKPPDMRAAERRLPGKVRNRRRNPASVRQGEWFFVPAPELLVEDWHILRGEPLTRTGRRSTPHVAEEAVRLGGETVYVSGRLRDPLGQEEYERLLARNPRARSWHWRVMRLNPDVYVRGRITHPDHRTLVLGGWHRVLMNTEGEARATRNVAFLD